MKIYNWLKRHRFEVNLLNAAVIAFWVMSFLHTGDGRFIVFATLQLLGAAALAWGLSDEQ